MLQTVDTNRASSVAPTDNAIVRSFFETHADDYTFPAASMRRRAELLRALVTGRVLDIGIGSGELTDLYAQQSVVGVDLAYRVLQRCRRHTEKASLVQADAERLPFPDGHFDTVIASEVIYYLSHPDDMMAEMLRVLARSGRAIVFTNNQRWEWLSRIMIRCGWLPPAAHRRFVLPNEAKDLFARHGFAGVNLHRLSPCVSISSGKYVQPLADCLGVILMVQGIRSE